MKGRRESDGNGAVAEAVDVKVGRLELDYLPWISSVETKLSNEQLLQALCTPVKCQHSPHLPWPQSPGLYLQPWLAAEAMGKA